MGILPMSGMSMIFTAHWYYPLFRLSRRLDLVKERRLGQERTHETER
jgi:hypothetical protein